ncbi:MAG TPA: hydroxymethylglutaryl-CoA lyase [Vicinamibacterales bacterium]|nr:hydroxymethylglutaryl-CoA lyase [Vicinamibacterales bacterium]
MSPRPQRITVVEVGPRDGLQNESARIPTAAKIAFVNDLSRAGFPVVEVAAFVSPKWVPQMADAAEVCAGIAKRPGTRYSALVPNLPGLERAHAAGLTEVAVFAASSESFSKRNINQSIDESLETYRAVCERARGLGIRVRGYLSTAFGCPFEGPVDPRRVAEVAASLIEMGAFEVAVSDTIGIAHPGQVPQVVGAVADRIGSEQIALHFHDTRGTALANVLAALDLGVATYDASAGGLGGCPYAPGATGNLASEDLLYMLNGLGIETGVDLEAVVEASARIAEHAGHPPVSRYFQAARAGRASSPRADPQSSS